MAARRISIRRGDHVCIEDGAGALVVVERGTAWLTQDSDRRDVVLRAGGSFRLDRAGIAVVSADGSAELTVVAPAGAGLPTIATWPRSSRPAGAGANLAYEL